MSRKSSDRRLIGEERGELRDVHQPVARHADGRPEPHPERVRHRAVAARPLAGLAGHELAAPGLPERDDARGANRGAGGHLRPGLLPIRLPLSLMK